MTKIDNLNIAEGVEAIWVYHIIKNDKSLCGHKTLDKKLPFTLWGKRTHNNEKYCKECEYRLEK